MKKLNEKEKEIIENNFKAEMAEKYIIDLLEAQLPSHKDAIKKYIEELKKL